MDEAILAHIVERFQQRKAGQRRWSSAYYHKNKDSVHRRCIINRIRVGVCPNRASVDRFGKETILDTWKEYVATQPRLSKRHTDMHFYITGERLDVN